jgi:transposase
VTRSARGWCRPTSRTATPCTPSPPTSPPTPPSSWSGSTLLVWLDRGFAGDGPAAFLQGHGIVPELVGTPGRRGFRVEPRRWKVEQTFGCLQRYRRLRVDDEASLATSRAMAMLASVFMTGMRLERMLQS